MILYPLVSLLPMTFSLFWLWSSLINAMSVQKRVVCTTLYIYVSM